MLPPRGNVLPAGNHILLPAGHDYGLLPSGHDLLPAYAAVLHRDVQPELHRSVHILDRFGIGGRQDERSGSARDSALHRQAVPRPTAEPGASGQ